MKIIILAGGKGTRLWPLSREHFSKQCLTFIEQRSLLDLVFLRALALSGPNEIVTVTTRDNSACVEEICGKVHPEVKQNLIVEPVGRNTAPTVALAVRYLIDKLNCPPDEVVMVYPADHLIEPPEQFQAHMRLGEKAARDGHLVVFGIEPTRPETGYGYIEIGSPLDGYFKADRFLEKPDRAHAEGYIRTGKHLWNSGIYAFKLSTFLEELKKYLPEVARLADEGYDKMLAGFDQLPSISLDYGLAERSDRVAAIKMELKWSDLGSWESFYELSKKDGNGNVIMGDIKVIRTRNCLVIGGKRALALVGLENSIIIDTNDALLITKMGEGQSVREVIEEFKKDKRQELL